MEMAGDCLIEITKNLKEEDKGVNILTMIISKLLLK